MFELLGLQIRQARQWGYQTIAARTLDHALTLLAKLPKDEKQAAFMALEKGISDGK